MNQEPIYTANYLREVEKLYIQIYELDTKDQLLWDEVEELLKDNGLWDGYDVEIFHVLITLFFANKNC